MKRREGSIYKIQSLRSHIVIINFAIWLASAHLQAQNDSKPSIGDSTHWTNRFLNSNFIVMPAAFYAPETGFGGGIAGFYFFKADKNDSAIQTSNVQAAVLYTQERQIIILTPYTLFLKGNNRWEGEFGFYKYPYQFFGVGNDIDLDESEFYTPVIWSMRSNFMFSLAKNFFAGPSLFLEHHDIVATKNEGFLETGNYSGAEGGLLNGLGLRSIYDSRKNVYFPVRSTYAELHLKHFNEAMGSDFPFTELKLDFRFYRPVAKDHILGFQAYTQNTSGFPPFFMYSELGGSYRMRGYFDGALRDKRFVSLQAEYRYPLFWRIRGAAFIGTGFVNDTYTLEPEIFRYSAGGGFRFLINEEDRVYIRTDIAVGLGDDTRGIYFTLGEAF